MQFQNEDGLTFSCKPLINCKFNIGKDSESETTNVAVITLDNEDYALFSSTDFMNCLRGARNFTSRYKITTNVYNVSLNKEDKPTFQLKFTYSYNDYLNYMNNRNK